MSKFIIHYLLKINQEDLEKATKICELCDGTHGDNTLCQAYYGDR